MKKLRFINSFVLSGIATVIFIAALTIAAELFAPLKDWLKNTFSHHWVGKSILSIMVLLIGSIAFQYCPSKFCRIDNLSTFGRNLRILSWISAIAAIAIFGFFVFEYFK